MEQTNKKCKTLSKMWRESGKQMPFKQFASLYNSGELDAYFSQKLPSIKKLSNDGIVKESSSQQTISLGIACPPKKEQQFDLFQIAAVAVIVLGSIYLITSKSE